MIKKQLTLISSLFLLNPLNLHAKAIRVCTEPDAKSVTCVWLDCGFQKKERPNLLGCRLTICTLGSKGEVACPFGS